MWFRNGEEEEIPEEKKGGRWSTNDVGNSVGYRTKRGLTNGGEVNGSVWGGIVMVVVIVVMVVTRMGVRVVVNCRGGGDGWCDCVW